MRFSFQRRNRLHLPCFILVGMVLVVYQFNWSQQPTEADPIYLDLFLVKPYMEAVEYSRLPNLTQLEWPDEPQAAAIVGELLSDGQRRQKPPLFDPVMSHAQRTLSKRLLKLFSDTMFHYGFGNRFFLMGATLLGSIRHHDFMPWDDDVDVLVDEVLRLSLRGILENLAPNYRVTQYGKRIKFFGNIMNKSDESHDLELSRQLTSLPWGWPFLDVGFYRQNATHVIEMSAYGSRHLTWPKTLVFPLRFRPLGHDWYPTPHSIIDFMVFTRTISINCLVTYDHAFEGRNKGGHRPCRELGDRYAFVRHCVTRRHLYWKNGTVVQSTDLVVAKESLMIGSGSDEQKIVHTLYLPTSVGDARLDTYDFPTRPEKNPRDNYC